MWSVFGSSPVAIVCQSSREVVSQRVEQNRNTKTAVTWHLVWSRSDINVNNWSIIVKIYFNQAPYVYIDTIVYDSLNLLLGDQRAIWLLAVLLHRKLDILDNKVGINIIICVIDDGEDTIQKDIIILLYIIRI